MNLETRDQSLKDECKKIDVLMDRVAKLEAQCSDVTSSNKMANKIGRIVLGTAAGFFIIAAAPEAASTAAAGTVVVFAIGSIGYIGYTGVKAAKDRCSIM